MRLLATLTVTVLLAAGCSSSPTTTSESATQDPSTASTQPMGAASSDFAVGISSAPEQIVYWVNGTTTANAAEWGLDTALALGIRALDLYVPRNVTTLQVEVRWDGPQDLDLEVHAPTEELLTADWTSCVSGQPTSGVWCAAEGNIGMPDSPIALRIPADEFNGFVDAGCKGYEWGDCNVFALGLRSKDANAMLDWTMAVTVAFDAPLDDGYSAFA